ncbi:parallel beta-helix repeat-containing protein [Collimonas sp. OK242]|uniref:parallel beta-helix domain-containing protein n=1 Tax=Collimonas sp. OK242 TaxID=1798195 RepID=UPI00089AB6AC|nr:parallel beta-helix domain-containing protein [Collimonas sp. OK242]SDY26494.1 parallel beta-helix repeat-containing protein [Collimonas sp. OK242]
MMQFQFRSRLVTAAIATALAACSDGGLNNSNTSTTPDNASSTVKVTASQMNDSDMSNILYQVKPGSTIILPPGKFMFDGPLTMNTDAITITGQGSGNDPSKDTILSFAGASSKNGFQAFNVAGITLKNFAVEDAVGNGVFVSASSKVTMDGLRAEWTNDPVKTSQMAYGLYPVNCKGVVVKNSKIVGTRDAGVYVGQSENIRVQKNEAYLNVAGIEIENSDNAIVEDNDIHDNTGGILVFSLPGTSYVIKKGANTKVRNNHIHSNNTPVAENATGYVTAVPPGTAVMVLAADNTEILNNNIEDHKTTSILAVSFQATGIAYNDPKYQPYVHSVYAHDNTISKSGYAPGGAFADPKQLKPVVDGLFAQLKLFSQPEQLAYGIWDGIVDTDPAIGSGTASDGSGGVLKPEFAICVKGNTLDTPFLDGLLSYESMDLNLLGLLAGSAQGPNFPFPARMNCTLSLPAIPDMPVF